MKLDNRIAIRAEDIGKSYRKGGLQTARYGTLRDAIAMKFRGGDPADNSAEPVGHETFWALKDVSFEIERGHVVGIIGKNGAGKSTLLKILARITEPTEGRVLLAGRVGSLLEVGTGFHPELSGRENVFLNGAVLGMTKSEVMRRFDEIVDFSGVESFIDTPVKRYSSGMYMRLAFAVAAHLDTEILLVDEVLAVGDLAFQKKCLSQMQKTTSEGRTVLFVSHNMGSINALCSTCIYLDQGSLVSIGKTADIVAQYASAGEAAGHVVISPDMRNRGSGEVAFEYCSITDCEGNQKNEFLIGEEINLEIGMKSEIEDEISFWLIIFDGNGSPILCTHQRDRETVTIDRGRFRLNYRTEGLNLNPGNYTITAGAFDRNRQFLEWIDNCQSFEVYRTFRSGAPFDGRWGAANQPAHWKLERVG